ncbi:MAG: hypothetical protein KDC52_11750 [Ignavibacteriae bacterium]|nr:hypothetical protein [Ignavibacteriota bacterium]MCB0752141.1 hypothetical protein [Ignavibacteriota bacterium]
MKTTIKIVALLAMAIGIMAVITGLRVIGGFFDPGYTYYLSLVSYNVIMGAVSVIAGIFIWQRNKNALLYSKIITILHILVLISLLTIFKDDISMHSIGAMTFRSVAWIIFTISIWKGNKVVQNN